MMTEILKPLYEVKLIENGKQHFYQIGADEKWYPGVTTVLGAAIPKPALLPWALNMMEQNLREFFKGHMNEPLTAEELDAALKEGKQIYKKKASEAADIGSRVHKAIDEIIHGQEPEITEDIRAGVEGFKSWKASKTLRIDLGDTKIASKLFGYGGSLDFVAFEGNEPVIFDLKTTKKRKDRDHGAYDEYGYQLAAYCQAFAETYGMRPKAAYILWVNKENPEFKAVKVENLSLCLEGFLSALKLYEIQKYEKFEREIIP